MHCEKCKSLKKIMFWSAGVKLWWWWSNVVVNNILSEDEQRVNIKNFVIAKSHRFSYFNSLVDTRQWSQLCLEVQQQKVQWFWNEIGTAFEQCYTTESTTVELDTSTVRLTVDDVISSVVDPDHDCSRGNEKVSTKWNEKHFISLKTVSEMTQTFDEKIRKTLMVSEYYNNDNVGFTSFKTIFELLTRKCLIFLMLESFIVENYLIIEWESRYIKLSKINS